MIPRAQILTKRMLCVCSKSTNSILPCGMRTSKLSIDFTGARQFKCWTLHNIAYSFEIRKIMRHSFVHLFHDSR